MYNMSNAYDHVVTFVLYSVVLFIKFYYRPMLSKMSVNCSVAIFD